MTCKAEKTGTVASCLLLASGSCEWLVACCGTICYYLLPRPSAKAVDRYYRLTGVNITPDIESKNKSGL